MDQIAALLEPLFGSGEEREIDALQMGLRAAIVYMTTLLIVRMGKKRFMSSASAFDVILGIMLGSIVSRAITGNAPFLPALVAAAVLIAMHWAFSGTAMRWHPFGKLIKGAPRLLIADGRIDWSEMKAAHMTEHDLHEELRAKTIKEVDEVAEGRLERDGTLSVIKRAKPPQIIDIDVEAGVKTIRLKIG